MNQKIRCSAPSTDRRVDSEKSHATGATHQRIVITIRSRRPSRSFGQPCLRAARGRECRGTAGRSAKRPEIRGSSRRGPPLRPPANEPTTRHLQPAHPRHESIAAPRCRAGLPNGTSPPRWRRIHSLASRPGIASRTPDRPRAGAGHNRAAWLEGFEAGSALADSCHSWLGFRCLI